MRTPVNVFHITPIFISNRSL